jgi:hypothetical protein
MKKLLSNIYWLIPAILCIIVLLFPGIKILSTIFWLIPAILCLVLLVPGIYSLRYHRELLHQKIFALAFFFILWIVSLYFLFQNKLNLTWLTPEKGKWFFTGLGSAAFVAVGIFIIITKPDQRKRGALGVAFFSICLVVSIIAFFKS